MASDEKSLKIGVKFDDKGGKAASNSLADLKKKAEDFNKSVGTLNKSLKTLNTELQAKVKDFKALSTQMTATGTIFKNQTKDVNAYTAALTKLNAALRNTTKAGKTSGGTATIVAGVAQPTSAATVSGLGIGNSAANPLYVTIVAGGGGGGAGGGQLVPVPGGGGGVLVPGNRRANISPQYLSAANIARSGLGAVGGVAQYYQSSKLTDVQNMGAVAGLRGGISGRMMGGDFSDAMALTIANNAKYSINEHQGGTNASALGSWAKGGQNIINGTVGGAAGGGPAGALAGFAGGLAKAGGGLMDNAFFGGKNREEAETMMGGLQAVKDINPVQMQIFQNLMSHSQAGLKADRRIRGRAAQSMWAGVGQGMSPEETWQFMSQGADKFGAGVMMGETKTSSKMVATGKMIPDPNNVAQPGSIQSAGEAAAYAKEVERRLATGTWNTKPEMALRTTTTGTEGIGGAALRMQSKGLNRDTMVGLMGGSQANLAGNDSTRSSQVIKMFEQAMSIGVSKGLTDPQVLEALGSAIGANVAASSGIGQNPYASILTQGMSNVNQNPALIANRAEGMEAFGQGIQGNNYLKNFDMRNTNKQLGGHASIGRLMNLQEATPAELMTQYNPEGTSKLDILGFSNEQRLTNLKNKVKLGVNSVANMSNDPEIKDMLKQAGGDPLKALKNPHFAQLISTLGGKTVGGMDVNWQGLNAFGGLADLDMDNPGDVKKFRNMAGPKSPFHQAAATQATTLAQGLSEAFNEKNAPVIAQSLNAVGDLYKTVLEMPHGKLDDAKNTIIELERLIKDIKELGVEGVGRARKRVHDANNPSE